MAEQENRSPRKGVVRQRPGAGEKPRPVLSFRVQADLHARLRASAEANELAMSEEVERRLEASFVLKHQNELLVAFRDLMRERDARLWPDKAVEHLVLTFSGVLEQAQQRLGKGWRDSECVAAVVVETIRTLMLRYTRRSLFEGLKSAEEISRTVDAIVAVMTPDLDRKMPPLPKLGDVQVPPTRVRMVHVFKDKATGAVLDTYSSRDFDMLDPADRPTVEPEYLALLEKHRPRRDEVDIDTVFAPVEKPGMLLWQATPEEAAMFKPLRGQIPPEIGDRAIFDEALSGLPLVQAEKAVAATRRKKAYPDDDQLQPAPAASAPKRGAGVKA